MGDGYRLDEIDRQIIYALMTDARNTSSPTIAEEANVSSATIRNRIQQLEERGIIRGYTAQVDFERANSRLTTLYVCNVPIAEREALARSARTVPGVVNVRELMTGRRNLHVLAVGEDTDDLHRIARTLSEFGIEIEDETLVQRESASPYAPFGPDEESTAHGPTNLISLTGRADVVEVTVREDARVANRSIGEVATQGILDDETLVVAIEREDRELTPHGETVLRPGDIVTLLSRGGDATAALTAFSGETSG
jgi:DNA-binding Lrp family transcriptional regulator